MIDFPRSGDVVTRFFELVAQPEALGRGGTDADRGARRRLQVELDRRLRVGPDVDLDIGHVPLVLAARQELLEHLGVAVSIDNDQIAAGDIGQDDVSGENAGLVRALGQVELLFTFVASIWFFGERVTAKEVVGAVLVILGLWLLLL